MRISLLASSDFISFSSLPHRNHFQNVGLKNNRYAWKRNFDLHNHSLNDKCFNGSSNFKRRCGLNSNDCKNDRDISNDVSSNLSIFPYDFSFSSDENETESNITFPNLPAHCPWNLLEVVSTMLIYECLVHVPFGIGGLSILSSLLNHKPLDPFLQGTGLFFCAVLDFTGSLFFIHDSLKSYKPFPTGWFRLNFVDIYGRHGLLVSVTFGLLSIFIVAEVGCYLEFQIMELLSNSDDSVSNFAPLQEALSGDIFSKFFIFFSYMFFAPALEETVYRGFLLTSLCFTLPIPVSIVLSSLVFSLAHFSLPNFIQLFFIGCSLSVTYLWSGNLLAPFLVHSMYNVLAVGGKLL